MPRKAGRPKGSYDGARKPDSILRKYWRIRQRAYRARERGDMDVFQEFDKQLRKLKKFVNG